MRAQCADDARPRPSTRQIATCSRNSRAGTAVRFRLSATRKRVMHAAYSLRRLQHAPPVVGSSRVLPGSEDSPSVRAVVDSRAEQVESTDPDQLYEQLLEKALAHPQTRRSLEEVGRTLALDKAECEQTPDPVVVERPILDTLIAHRGERDEQVETVDRDKRSAQANPVAQPVQADELEDSTSWIRAAVLADREKILRTTSAYFSGWQAAIDRHEAAVDGLEPVRRRLRRGKRWTFAIWVVGLVAVSTWAISSNDAGLFIVFFFPGLFGAFPWMNAKEAYDERRRELRLDDRERDREAARRRHLTVLREEVTAATRRAINGTLKSFDGTFRSTWRTSRPNGSRTRGPDERDEQLQTLMSSSQTETFVSRARVAAAATLIHSFATSRSLLPFDRQRRDSWFPPQCGTSRASRHASVRMSKRFSIRSKLLPLPRVGTQATLARLQSLSGSVSVLATVLVVTGAAMLVSGQTAPRGLPKSTAAPHLRRTCALCRGAHVARC